MKALVAPRTIKAIDQVEMGGPYGSVQYVKLTHFLDQPVGGVTPGLSRNIITVPLCVRMIAATFASLPLMVYRCRPDGGKEKATDHPLYPVLHDQPNPG